MAVLIRYAFIYIFGGIGYGLLEILFRGYTHWTMCIAGGLCFLLIYLIAVKSKESLWKKWIMSGAVITTVEFVTGSIVNIILDWNVWSYTHQTLNLMGQICILFSAIWVVLSIPAIWICHVIHKFLFNDNRKIKEHS